VLRLVYYKYVLNEEVRRVILVSRDGMGRDREAESWNGMGLGPALNDMGRVP